MKVCYDGKPDVELNEAMKRTMAVFGYYLKELEWYTKENITNLLFEKEVEQG